MRSGTAETCINVTHCFDERGDLYVAHVLLTLTL